MNLVEHDSIYMDFVSLSIFFWRYALESACYILNKILRKLVTKTPYEIWTGCRSILFFLRVWGCLAFVKHLQTDKLGPRSDKYYFIGYLKKTRGYYFYLIDEQKLFTSNKVSFLE